MQTDLGIPQDQNKAKPKLPFIAIAAVALFRLGCGVDKSNLPEHCEFEIEVTSDTVEVSSPISFEFFSTCGPLQVCWSVEDTLGGTPSIGMITQHGLYIAPAKIPASGSVKVCAKAVDDTVERCKHIFIVDSPQSIRLIPSIAKVAIQDSLKFTTAITGCVPDSLVWSIEKIVGQSIGGITSDGVYHAPSTLRGDVAVMVMAQAKGCSNKIGLARLEITLRSFWVEAEDFTDSSGTGIVRGVSCGGGKGVAGLDAPDEWIEIPIDVPATGFYQPWIWYASAYKDTLKLAMTTDGCGEDTSTIRFVLKDGTGVGG